MKEVAGKTGERAGSPTASSVQPGAWSLGAAGLHAISVARSALDYQSQKVTRDAPVIERMKALAAQYPRFGYRRIGIFLGRDGYEMSLRPTYRLWQGAGLQVPRRRPRKRVASSRPRPQAPTAPNLVWSYDFGSTAAPTASSSSA